MHKSCITKHARKKCPWKFSKKKSLEDCSLVPVWKFKCKVRLAVQLADLQGETIQYIGFHQNRLNWRENLSAHVTCVETEARARMGKV